MAKIDKPAFIGKVRATSGPARRVAKPSDANTAALPRAGPPMPPTAQRLLEAARRLLARSGYNSLSVAAIGREAGENKALIRYYFGSKNGLIVALVDWLVSDTLRQSRQRLTGISAGQSPSETVTGVSKTILDDPPSYRLFFDLLPRLLENASMTQQFAELYRAYREQTARLLWLAEAGEVPQVVRDIAAMSVALTDGLAVQILVEPGSVAVDRMLDLWSDFIDRTLASTLTAGQPPETAKGPEARGARDGI